MIAAFGLPIAYAAAFVWGVPVLYVLHRLGWLRPATLIVAGALGGAMVAAWFAFEQQGTLIRVHMPLPGGAMLGALVGGTCWWAGQGKAKWTGRLTSAAADGPPAPCDGPTPYRPAAEQDVELNRCRGG